MASAEFGAALTALVAARDDAGLCDLVATAFAGRSDVADLAEIAALIEAIPDETLARHPDTLLELIRACDSAALLRLRTRLMSRAERLPDRAPGVALALQAERIVRLAIDTRADEVEQQHDLLAARLAVAPASTYSDEARARSAHALGRALSWRGDPESMSRAEDALRTAEGLARRLGRVEWRASSLLTLGYGVYYERGDDARGTATLQEAIALLPEGHPRRTGIATFLAEALVRSHLGDTALDLLAEIRTTATITGDQRSLGYAAWIMAIHTAEQGERAATLEWLAEAERHPGDWFAHSTGSEFLAEAALCAERVGDETAADSYLARAVHRADADGYPETAWLADGVINSRRGDPAGAIEELPRLLAEPWFPARDAWFAWLHLAAARQRTGDHAGAGRDAARGFEAALSMVGPGRVAADGAQLAGVLRRLEPELVQRLALPAARAGSAVATSLVSPAVRVQLFGGLAAFVDGQSAPVPPGKSAELVVLLAIARRPLPIDVVVDRLWPGSTSQLGRRRLRNVLARTRARSGDLVVRTGDAVALAAGAEVDVDDFERAARAVSTAPAADQESKARAALLLYRDDLLPEAAYDPNVLLLRDELARHAGALLTLIADAAERDGRVHDAVDALGRLAALDPYDPSPLLRGAALLQQAGRRDQAAEWTLRAGRIELD